MEFPGKRGSTIKSATQKRATIAVTRDAYFAQAIGKAFRCLEVIRNNPEPLTLTDVRARLGGAKSSIFRILHTLEALGYVQRDAAGRYQQKPGSRGVDPFVHVQPLIRAAESRMKLLVRDFEETASLAALFENHVEVVAVMESPQMIRMGNLVGRILPPHASSLGKCIAAFQSESRREKLIRSYGVYRYTDNTITTIEKLQQEFARIRECGWATDAEENMKGGLCFGAPIFSGGPDAVGAISVSLPVMRLSGGVRERLVSEVRRYAAEISEELFGRNRTGSHRED
jgi:IclR family acetate operon transcriptional repressor